MTAELGFRPPSRPDLFDCALVWHVATDDYMARLNKPLPSPYLDPLLGLLDHLLATDGERFLVAVRPPLPGLPPRRPDRVVAFGVAAQREHVWYLSQLYVLPEEQGRGIGRSLLVQILPSMEPAPKAAGRGGEGGLPTGPRSGLPNRRDGVLATCTDSAQPVASALYARFGIVPRMPVFNLVGVPAEPSRLPPLPADVVAVPIEVPGPGTTASRLDEVIAAIDRSVLGYAHPRDHAFLRSGGRTAFLYLTSGGDPLGYGYSSEAGRFGPVAVLDETLTAPVLGHLMTEIRPRGATSAWVPGANDRAMVALLRAGLRIEGFPAQLCWTRPFGAFERYLPAGLALL
jgi:GNAT superfamily N-acetyltransferase